MLIAIVGGMFSEKTTELQRRGKRLSRAGKRVLYVKPDFDTRYSNSEVVTHDGAAVEAVNIKKDNPIELLNYAGYDVICIDEVQFFDIRIIDVVNALVTIGKTVIVAGLDMDYTAKPFAATALLAGQAEEVVKLKAICATCGNDSWVTAKASKSNSRIELGSGDIYYPLCRKCYNDKKFGGLKNENRFR